MTSNKPINWNQLFSNISWKDKISNHHQLGGIETSILDNGPGKGVRIAWIDTGSGLRYKVVLDRAMNIADAFFNQYNLSWISHLGVTAPNQAADYGMEWLKTFGGGLLVTCGLSHIGDPESDDNGDRGLHGRISNQQAEIVSIIQPDPVLGQLEMSITGVIKESCVSGLHLELKRTISSTIGQPKIRIHDEVFNRGNELAPHMILYHCNLGWPLVDEGTSIFCNGKWQSRGSEMDNQIFVEGGTYQTCSKPIEMHNGTGESCGFIEASPDAEGLCKCGLFNPNLKIAFELSFRKEQLPWLTNWQHWGKGEYVTGLEPGTNPPIGQAKAREQGNLIYLEPGECRTYDIDMEVVIKDE